MTTALVLLISLFVVINVWLYIYAYQSKSGEAPGLVNNQLTHCPAKKNCVCSEFSDDTRYFVEPLTLTPNITLTRIKNVIEEMGGVVVKAQDEYLAATFTSSLFAFVDDLEIRIDPETKLVHFRSASRVGNSDLGVNSKRVQTLKEKLT